MDDEERHATDPDEVARLARVSDDLTERLVRESLELHEMRDERCVLCRTAWPCPAVELDEDALREIERRRRERGDGL